MDDCLMQICFTPGGIACSAHNYSAYSNILQTLFLLSFTFFWAPCFNTFLSPHTLWFIAESLQLQCRGHITSGEPSAPPPPLMTCFPACLWPITAHCTSLGETSVPMHLFISSIFSLSRCALPFFTYVTAEDGLPHNWVILYLACSEC